MNMCIEQGEDKRLYNVYQRISSIQKKKIIALLEEEKSYGILEKLNE